MENCDTFIRHLSSSLRTFVAESCSAGFLRQMLLSIAKRFCVPISQAQQEDPSQTRLRTLKEDSASRRGVAVIRAAPLPKARAISSSAQYIC
jgi:hypothetical protein